MGHALNAQAVGTRTAGQRKAARNEQVDPAYEAERLDNLVQLAAAGVALHAEGTQLCARWYDEQVLGSRAAAGDADDEDAVATDAALARLERGAKAVGLALEESPVEKTVGLWTRRGGGGGGEEAVHKLALRRAARRLRSLGGLHGRAPLGAMVA